MKRQILSAALLAAAPMLASCITSQETPVASAQSAADDDAYCRAHAGEPGSAVYVNCRKDRDVGAIRSDARMEQAHRNLAESMLNGH